MKTVGQVIKEARVKRRLSKEKLEEVTKIKESFIDAIERENWEKLPEYPVLQGFVSSIAKVLRIDTGNVSALLRRDYPPKKLDINPKPDFSEKFSWSPKLTFIAGTVFVALIVSGYLIFQYVSFISPPKLVVYEPAESREITQATFEVRGKTDSDAVIKVNNQTVLVDDDGNFSEEIKISQNSKEVEIIAISRSGKETKIMRKIIPKLEE